MIVTTLRSLTVADGKIDLPMDVYFFESAAV